MLDLARADAAHGARPRAPPRSGPWGRAAPAELPVSTSPASRRRDRSASATRPRRTSACEKPASARLSSSTCRSSSTPKRRRSLGSKNTPMPVSNRIVRPSGSRTSAARQARGMRLSSSGVIQRRQSARGALPNMAPPSRRCVFPAIDQSILGASMRSAIVGPGRRVRKGRDGFLALSPALRPDLRRRRRAPSAAGLWKRRRARTHRCQRSWTRP